MSNATPEAGSTLLSGNTYSEPSAPNLRAALTATQITGPGVLARSEITYDNPLTTGNAILQRVWDSTRGGVTAPLTSDNAVSTSTEYNGFGQPLLTTDARGTQTRIVYGSINGYTDLYPTETIVGDNAPNLARHTQTQYDFWTGAVTQTTDVENNLTNQTGYDALGRPVLAKSAVGTPLETHTATIYDDAARRVVTKADLNAKDDGKIVAVQHYDQLGRVRLARQLENPTDDPTDETIGIKVQTRYLTTNSCTYALSSQPYRAATMQQETSTQPGWTLSESDQSGQVIRVETFTGAAMPAPWGSNAASSGTVITAYDAQYTTVTDQAGRQRRSVMDALGRLVRVDEPDKTTGALGSVSAPVQPTAYGYDGLGNLTTVRQGGNGTTLADYTGGQTRTFAYNSLSRLMSATNPESGTLSYTYDANGNLLTKTEARLKPGSATEHIRAEYTYDALNRNTQVTYNDGTPSVTRRYDGAMPYGKGKLWQTETTHTALVTVDNFDALGRPGRLQQQFWTANAWSAPYTLTRSYGLTQLEAQSYPSGHTTTYGYDALGRLASFAGNLGDGVTRTYAQEMVYDAAGRLTREKYETLTRLYHKQQYNGRGQLWDMQLGTDSSFGPATPDVTSAAWNRGRIINHYSNNFQLGQSGNDNNGNLLRQEIYLPNAHFTQQNYSYDALNRLTSAAEKFNGTGAEQWRQQYDYDLYGNRTVNQTATTGYGIPKPHFTVDTPTNRLLVPTGVAGTMSYDAAGNLSYDTYTGSGTRTFDAENRLKQAWSGVPTNGYLQGQYTYDGDGRRIARTIGNGGATTWQVYGLEGELVAEYAAQAHALLPQKEYGYQGGKLLISAVNGDETRLRRFVENFYLRTWLTLPDQATIQAQVNALAAQGLISHAAMLQHAQQFGTSLFTSTNYLNRNTTNGMYVADLYLAYLQRPPDEGGFEYWKELLDENLVTRATLRDAFAGYGYSPSEYGGILEALRASGVNDYDRVDRFVNYVYTATSGNGQTGPTTAQRDAERARFDVAEAQNRDAVRTAAEQLATELLGATANNYRIEWSDTEYVRRLYETFLRHAPDVAGWDYWTGEAEKQGRAGVLGAFLDAGAYREQADALYREIYWLVGDHLGTPRLIVSRTGSLASVKRHDYLPFGEELPVGAGGRATSQGYVGDSVRQQFTGYERDDETGLDYAQARYYGSAMGRFTSTDNFLVGPKIEDPQSWNLYAYVSNNPLKLVDPTGEQGRVTITTDDKNKTGVITIEANFAVYTASGTTLTQEQMDQFAANFKAQLQQAFSGTHQADGYTFTFELKVNVQTFSNTNDAGAFLNKDTQIGNGVILHDAKTLPNPNDGTPVLAYAFSDSMHFAIKAASLDPAKGHNIPGHEFVHSLGFIPNHTKKPDSKNNPGNENPLMGQNDLKTGSKLASYEFKPYFGTAISQHLEAQANKTGKTQWHFANPDVKGYPAPTRIQ